METAALQGGFSDTARQSAEGFRACLQAMARPGTIHRIAGATPPAPLSPAAAVALLVLADATTPVHLAGAHDVPLLRDWITFHTGAPLVEAGDAVFALGAWQALEPGAYAIGTAEYPDRSATLIVEMAALRPEGARLSGPGIRDRAALNLPEVAAFQRNAALFPLGLDFIFTCGDRLAALPRTTRVS
ncbi:phosphonate C-P lyase system protein PhnH [Plastorhodobacter daqingensis]|uniref:Phosphonate C-P lyase system protein PhnH n=1 Tax=Plastorhodobacter daqingensis TaxID=1387281 RepID=A0ABW2UFW2_9RHOB